MDPSPKVDLLERIRNALPEGYGSVSVNGETMPVAPRIGIVIPTFSRTEYVQQTLTSLQHSNLPEGCLLVIVDETMASKEAVDGPFEYFENVDFVGGDLTQIKGSLEEIFKEAAQSTSCVACNEAGWLKHTLANPRRIRNSRFGTYIKTSYLQEHPDVHHHLLEQGSSYKVEADAETVAAIEAFDMDLPVIKIFKTHHKNMFDSLRVAFDLLTNHFHVQYLVNLDSDTLHTSDWLTKLLQAHQALQQENPDRPLIVSGFNADRKKNLHVRGEYVIKENLGGVNLFFDTRTYRSFVRNSLINIGWDYELSESIRNHDGILVALRTSVVQHIGKEGMWSSPRDHDSSSTFQQPGAAPGRVRALWRTLSRLFRGSSSRDR